LNVTHRSLVALAILFAWAISITSQELPAETVVQADVGSADFDSVFVLPDSQQVVLDSLMAFVQGQPVDSIRAALRDSLFLPRVGTARIVRDGYGVPHIYGERDADVAFGFGYAQAEDHLVEMLLNYRQARGRVSEILGKDYLESDHLSQLWRIESVAGERYGTIPEQTRSLIGAFAEGVNHYIGIHRHLLPDWVEPVSGTDIVALSRWLMFLAAEQTGASELGQQGMAPAFRPGASNQWVVSPHRSESGATLFAMDPHLPWSREQQMYEAHLVSAEGMQVAGGTPFGFPVITVGHTDRMAWSLTVSDPDVFDLYEVKLDPNNPRRYLYGEETRRMTSRSIRIPVRQGDDVVQVERDLVYTHHGPVYRFREGWAYAARFSIQDGVNVIGQLYAMNRAASLGQFRDALRQLELPMFNIVYGDVDGNLYYVYNARSPVRSDAYDFRRVVPGWTPESEWQGILEFDRLPQVTNPPAGFLQNCNDAPDLITPNSGLRPEDFPSGLGWGQATARGTRLFNYLSANEVVSVDQMKSMIRDNYLLDAEELKGHILRAYNASWPSLYDPDSKLARAIDLLRNWDNRASVDSRATLLFAVWKERFDPLLSRLPVDQRRDLTVLENLALESLRSAVAYMEGTYGRLDVRWGDVHVIPRGDSTYAVGGSPTTAEALHRTWSAVDGDGIRSVVGGSAFSMVVAMADTTVQAWSLVPFGSSEDRHSPHYADQAALQDSDVLKPAWFSLEEVDLNLESITTVPFPLEQLDIERERAMWRVRLRETTIEDWLTPADDVSQEGAVIED